MLTRERLAQIKARRAVITPGPWEGIDDVRGHHHFQFVRSTTAFVENDRGPRYAIVILDDEEYETKSADIAFVANAPTDMDDLIAEIERLQTLGEKHK